MNLYVEASGQLADLTSFSLVSETKALKNVIAIKCYGRSGTIFLQSLLDDHPNTITTPGGYFTTLYEFYEQHQTLDANALIDKFINAYAVLFDARKQFGCWGFDSHADIMRFAFMGPNQDQILMLDQQTFTDSLRAILLGQQVTRKFFFQAVHAAYHRTRKPDVRLTSDMHIVFQQHEFVPNEYSSKLMEDFPETRYLLMVREPISTLGSMYRHAPAAPSLEGGLTGGTAPLEWQSKSAAIRLEDLHKHPEDVMKSVCRWLELPWNDSLLKSTFQGLEWWGDTSSARKNGFVESLPIRCSAFSAIDEFRLRVLLWPKFKAWNYQCPDWHACLAGRLAVLALLVVPFSMETNNWAAIRNNRLQYWQNRAGSSGLSGCAKYVLWLTWVGVFLRFLQTRGLLIRHWLLLYRPQGQEIRLLPVQLNQSVN